MKDLRDIFAPNRCLHCLSITSRNTQFLCTDCHLQLTHTHYFNYNQNPLEKLFWGKTKIEQASSLYFYEKKTPIQTLLKKLKYQGLQSFGLYAAKTIISELKTTDRFKNITKVIPVPLHSKKEKQRGYNQVDVFGQTLANFLNVPYQKDALIKVLNSKSQTKQTKEERHHSVKNLFATNPKHILENEHVLLIDDVLTTGATLISCCKAIEQLNNVKISIITIAYVS